jgi:hypothetical protein
VIRRRRFIGLIGAAGAATGLPWLWGCRTPARPPAAAAAGGRVPRFLSAAERRTLDALAAALVPEDQTVGAVGAGAVEYIDRLLSAFDAPVPALYRGGPFSGRAPYPDPRTGAPSGRFPRNDFEDPLPPTRLQELAFRIALEGSDSVPGGAPNAALVPRAPGWRALYREGLADLEARAGGRFAELEVEARLAAFDAARPEFQTAVLEHLAEGMFCAPEYGGNRAGVAWRDYAYDGDSQPLGHTLFDRERQLLYDRPDQPNQSPDPARPARPLDGEVAALLEALVRSQGGRRFF